MRVSDRASIGRRCPGSAGRGRPARVLGGHRLGQDQQQLVAAFRDLGSAVRSKAGGKIAELPVTRCPRCREDGEGVLARLGVRARLSQVSMRRKLRSRNSASLRPSRKRR